MTHVINTTESPENNELNLMRAVLGAASPSSSMLTQKNNVGKRDEEREKNSGSSCTIHGADFSALVGLPQEDALKSILNSYLTTGLQATQIGRARRLIAEILHRRRLHSPCEGGERQAIFISYTSNLISSGLRELFVYLAKERLVDAFVSTAGGIEEDIIKCLGPTLLGSFHLSGTELRKKGLNRIGNLLVPNDNYCLFEDFFTPILKEIHADQRGCRWMDHTAPSQFISRMAKRVAQLCPPAVYEQSLLYWCDHHHIPVFCPAFTDGSMGDMLYFYNFSRKGIVVDPVRDVFLLRSLANGGPPPPAPTSNAAEDPSLSSRCSSSPRCAAFILGGGLPKHHLLHNIPMHHVIMITTGNEADGCTSSGTLRDDCSSGLIPPPLFPLSASPHHQHSEAENNERSARGEVIKIQGDATLLFPLLLSS